MSHFSLLITGENIEKQLQPFHEYESTGIRDEYVIEVDLTQEILDYIKYCDCSAKEAVSSYGYEAEYNADGTLKRAWQLTNPNSKWDWWLLGGRFTGFWKLKPGCSDYKVGEPGTMTAVAQVGTADQARKCDIDFDGMIEDHLNEQLAIRESFMEIVNDRKLPDWNKIREGFNDIDLARAAYNSIPVIADLDKDEKFSWDTPEKIVRYNRGIDHFKTRESKNAVSTFAVLHQGKWMERGEMGWWGIVLDEKEQGDWDEQFNKFLASLPDDTLLSIVDCHI